MIEDSLAENAYNHWKQDSCNCKYCGIFRLILKSYNDYNFMNGFKIGFPELWEVFKKRELKNGQENIK